jgi:hypothetical protein
MFLIRGNHVSATETVVSTEALGTSTYFPELVLCLCAAVGTDTNVVSDALASELRSVGYKPVPIRLSALMAQIPGLEYLSELRAEDERISESMKAGNEIRRIIGHADAVVRLALSTIHSIRASLNDSQDVTVPAERHCFIVTSLKRDEEFEALRRLFGQRVLLASVYEPREHRVENLCRKIARLAACWTGSRFARSDQFCRKSCGKSRRNS